VVTDDTAHEIRAATQAVVVEEEGDPTVGDTSNNIKDEVVSLADISRVGDKHKDVEFK